jgi:intracellular septation protein
MGAATELIPLLLFFVAFKVFGIFAATGVAVAAIAFQIGLRVVRGQRVEPMLWVTGIIALVFGGATLVFRDETFIKWKPTVLYWCGSLALLIGHFGFDKNFVRDALAKSFDAPADLWLKLLFSWAGFLVVLGVLNLYVAYQFSSETWVTYKVFGSLVLLLSFAALQTAALWRYAKQSE